MSQEKLKHDEVITPANVGAVIKILAIAKRLYANLYVYYRRQRKRVGILPTLGNNTFYLLFQFHILRRQQESYVYE